MTPDQQSYYFVLWKKACEAQGWTTRNGYTTKQITALRYEQHRIAKVPASSKDINTKADFDAIKARFLFLDDKVQGAVETDHPEEGEKRRLLKFIRNYQFALLRPLNVDGEQYIKPIIRNRWRASILEDVSAVRQIRGGIERSSPLEMLRFDLTRAIQTKRKAAGWTVHELHAAAELPCPHNCKQCEIPVGASSDQSDNIPF